MCIKLEVIYVSSTRINNIAFARPCTILHIGGHAAVTHQLGNGLHFLCSAGGGEGGGHIGVVVGGAVVVDGEGTVSVVVVAVGAAAVEGVAPVVDDLGHGGGYAAGDGVAVGAVSVLGAEGIVVLALVPGGGEQGSDAVGQVGERRRGVGGGERQPFGGGRLVLLYALLSGGIDLESQVVEESGDLRREGYAVAFVGHGPGAREAVAQHGTGHVVGRHDDEGRAHVDDIHGRLAAPGHGVGVDHHRGQPFGTGDALRHKGARYEQGLLRVDGTGLGQRAEKQKKEKEKASGTGGAIQSATASRTHG